jgi:hypothetical protein
MSVGLAPQKGDIDNELGNLCRQINSVMSQISTDAFWANLQTDQTLQNLGYSSADMTTYHAVLTALGTLNQIYTGKATLGTATNFQSILAPVFGFGH